ncbi:hypothetical protein [Pseudobacteriovorax antillogorgiicola]|uniref:Uncharacterized protein n=1 Tax=Pseudobacteriovorax antillogorgiicola TaxID=1513793 RepID=A0A1Y6BU80_9BACT|nr:hypothetical protein [Pseudobacteriovorax antillogorgiicola]TCS53847.1 hypothetical protein EDD56_107156 [Pseudobacteriovorax antillogorgiicola]SMF21607.1 hypothetical protein SAMN06296036_107116 [Pseudobacteriovorax antillogorgiicola]
MKITFPESETKTVVDNLKDAMGERALSKIVSFEINGDDLTVTLSKLGKSTLHFSRQSASEGSTFTLTKEKIALAHKALKGEVTQKIIKVIEKAGGSVDK